MARRGLGVGEEAANERERHREAGIELDPVPGPRRPALPPHLEPELDQRAEVREGDRRDAQDEGHAQTDAEGEEPRPGQELAPDAPSPLTRALWAGAVSPASRLR